MTATTGPADYTNLIKEAEQRLGLCNSAEGFGTGIPQAEKLLNDLENFPHHYVLACLMDRQVKAERAWKIPYIIGEELGGFGFSVYANVSAEEFQKIFETKRLHRFNTNMSLIFFRGIQRIKKHYDGDAKNIWVGNPPCARVVRRFLEFAGAGPKIATMATNILLRQFKIPMTNRSAIDISADVQVMKYFQNKGLLRKCARREELILLAREISPDYPGLLDLLAWEGGRQNTDRSIRS